MVCALSIRKQQNPPAEPADEAPALPDLLQPNPDPDSRLETPTIPRLVSPADPGSLTQTRLHDGDSDSGIGITNVRRVKEIVSHDFIDLKVVS